MKIASMCAVGALFAAAAAAALLLTGRGFPEPDTPLAHAAQHGDAAEVVRILKTGTSPDAPEGHGMTPLVLAARWGHIDAARALLAGGADPNRFDAPSTRPGWTPLMNAVHKGQREAVRLLLESGADVNLRASDGTTALTLAAPEEDVAIVEVLLAAGADPGTGPGGSAALTSAVAAGRVGNVRALLRHNPELRLEGGVWGKLARVLARARGQREILDLISDPPPPRAGSALDGGPGSLRASR